MLNTRYVENVRINIQLNYESVNNAHGSEYPAEVKR